MQYTSKFALLAAAIFGASALAIPLAPRTVDHEIEAREVDTDLSAREFYDMYLEARADPSLDAREVYSMDLEAREYLEYLEAREAANDAATSSHPDSQSLSKPSKPVDESVSKSSTSDEPHDHHEHGHKHEQDSATHQGRKARAMVKFRDSPKLYEAALHDKKDPRHKYAVERYLSRHPSAFEKALADKKNVYHPVAKLIAHHRKEAKKYLSSKAHYNKALEHKSNKYHGAAVRKFLSNPKNMQEAIDNKDSKFHKYAVALEKQKQRKEAHHKHGHESTTTTGAEPTKAGDVDATHPATPTSGASSKLAARSY